MEPILLSWSGGKDSALALHRIQQAGEYRVVALLTVLSQAYDRISHHGVRSSLLEMQAHALGIPLKPVYLSENASNQEYEAKMLELLTTCKEEGIYSVAFGDIFLADIRRYRENNLARVSMQGVFPLWGEDTTSLAHQFIGLGFKAVVCCVDPRRLDSTFAGKEIDHSFLADLPAGVDPCGENGEFHSFVYDGPIFTAPIPYRLGEKVTRPEGNCFCDILPAQGTQHGEELR